MAAFQKHNAFVESIAEKKFDLGGDTLKIMLTLTAPTAANSIKTDLTEISAGNGYSAGGTTATTSSSAQTAGTYKLVLADVVFTASGGAIANFRYTELYDDTATNDDLAGFWDYGSTVTLLNGETFTWDADPSAGVLTIA